VLKKSLVLFIAVAVLLPSVRSIAQTVSKKSVRLAICQILVIDSDGEGNFRRIEYALQQASAQHAQIAVFPESSILGWENPDAHRMAEPIPGKDSDRVAALARKYGTMIAIGLDEKDGDGFYDSAILVDRSGRLLWKHRKINVLPELMTPPYSQGRPEDIGVVETELDVSPCSSVLTRSLTRSSIV
jgi:predicted amidohydrolase